MHSNNNHDGQSVSVIIPTHNRLDTLKNAITSVLEQSQQAHEIIVIDDGSTDGTAQWLAHQDLPIVPIIQTNNGVSHARNRGIEHSTGAWLALLDSDDYWHRDKLEKQMNALAQTPGIGLCHCDEIWVRNGVRINQKYKHQKYGGYIYEHCLPLCAISPSAAVIHRDVFSRHGLFDETLPACEDYDLWLRICSQEPVLFLDQLLLTKTGGHDDQLSARYPVMDRFRLQSLAKLIRSGLLTEQQRIMAFETFMVKLHIVQNGAKKRGNKKLLQQLESDYADLLRP